VTYRSFGALLVVVGLLMAVTAQAEDGTPGRAAYLKYCSACHGPEGKGDGIVSGLMQPKPSNLTVLASRNGGKFPTARVRDTIDGRTHLAAHGESGMPVWGEVFMEEKAIAQSPAQVRGKVQLIADYLATIQTQAAPE
jgi:mono/diheme cytochrome c family protein